MKSQELEKPSELKVTFDVLLECTNLNLNKDLDYILDSFTHENAKYTILCKNDTHYTVFNRLFDLSKLLNKCNVVKCYQHSFAVHDLVYKSPRSYHVFSNVDKQFPNFMSEIKEEVESRKAKFTVYKRDGLTFVSNLAYFIIAGKNECCDYYENLENIIKHSKENDLYTEI